MTKEQLIKLVDEIIEDYGFEDAPAYDLFLGMDEDEIINLLIKFNK